MTAEPCESISQMEKEPPIKCAWVSSGNAPCQVIHCSLIVVVTSLEDKAVVNLGKPIIWPSSQSVLQNKFGICQPTNPYRQNLDQLPQYLSWTLE